MMPYSVKINSVLRRNHLLSFCAQHGRRHGGVWNYVYDSLYRGRALFRSLFRKTKPGPEIVETVLPRLPDHERSFFKKAVLPWVRDSQAAQLRKERARQLFAGARKVAPMLGLCGVCLVKEPSLLSREDQLEGVCQDIRDLLGSFPREKSESFLHKKQQVKMEDLEIGKPLGKGCNAVVYGARWKSSGAEDADAANKKTHWDLAVKVMFNYDAQSNAAAIWNCMKRECIPARINLLSECKTMLPSHPNIVNMLVAFADRMPLLPNAQQLYPNALPTRLHRRGYGRNMTLFLVMKRYHCTLREFLRSGASLGGRVALALLCQILEGILHINRHGIAHRDLKTDNFLLDLSAGPTNPQLALADFGCCLADNPFGLRVPFVTADVCRDGNPALMAPEVSSAVPGMFSVLDYSRADLWAVGTLVYELYGAENPFYGGRLDSRTYREVDLPPLPVSAPPVLRRLVSDVLKRDPSKRPSASVAATVCQLLLHAPLRLLAGPCDSQSALEWLCNLAATTIWEPKATLQRTLLARVQLATVLEALQYIHSSRERDDIVYEETDCEATLFLA
ncbi:serine/threonine-protein kinase Pink1, mitochondrial-like [Ornithodoros turicata]|uniref:serine/threonine-protein kinase Pink1, mitochondrial-like n=1 Tax=Ornithodoros turicata TaxID=34597 RepID=UPI003138DD70